MAKLSEVGAKHFTLLLYGMPKIGKTVLASQFPNVHMLDLDDGVSVVKNLAREQNITVDFPVIQIDENKTTDKDFIDLCGNAFASANAWTKAKVVVERWAKKLTHDDTIVIDNTSALSEFLLYSIKKGAKMEIQDWMTFSNEMQHLVGTIQNAIPNVVLVAHEEYSKDEATGELHRTILMPSRQKYRIPGRISDLIYMRAEVSGPRNKRVVKRYVQSTPDILTPAGSRALIPDIENPTFESMRRYLEDSLGRKLPEASWTPKT